MSAAATGPRLATTDELVLAALRDPAAVGVRRRVLRQLVSSLVYEGALTTEPEPDEGRRRDDGQRFGRHVVRGRDVDGAPVRYRFALRRAIGFDRVRLSDEPVERVAADGAVAEVDSLPRFLDECRSAILAGAHPEELARFAREIEETRVKDALSAHVRVRRGDVLAGADHDTLEGTITDGHRYHPAYKSRIGFDLDDDVAFSPEFLPDVRPYWVAAHRSISEVTSSSAVPSDLARTEIAGVDPAVPGRFDARVRDAGGEPAEYVWLPVHPWQWREVIRRAFADELADGRLVALGPDPAAFAPSQSVRTMACRDDPTRSQLKTSLSITNTSTARGLAPHTVRNAAPISDWLTRLVARDPDLAATGLVVLPETHGVSVTVARSLRADVEGSLAAIWRGSLAPHLAVDEQAVPATGLTATETDGSPLVGPWVRRHGAEAWVAALVDAVTVPLVHLLVRHGVALESHAQNMSVILADGLPRRVALRDFHDGVRFSRRLVALAGDRGEVPPLDPPPAHHANANSFVETDDPTLVVDFLLDAYFFVNLGELGLFLDEHHLLDEAAFWAIVARRVRAHQDRHGTGAFDLFAPTLAVEKLTTRRLAPDTVLHLHTVTNPLYRYGPEPAASLDETR